MFRIGEFAAIAGVSAKTLRAWDELGLFRPAWVDPDTAYRGYSPAQLPELRRIAALRDVGVSLGEIAALIAGGADLRDVLLRRRAELERERREVERRLQALDISVSMAGQPTGRALRPPVSGTAPGPGALTGEGLDVVVRPIATEAVAMLRVDPPERDIGEAFYELESCVRDQGRRAGRPPGAIVEDGRDGATDLYVPLSGPIRPCGAVAGTRLPGCRVASTLVRGSYAGLPGARRRLDAWIAAVGLVPAAPLRIVYLQFGAEPELRVPERYLVGRAADLVTELQRPVVPVA